MAIKKDIDLNILPNRTSPISIEMVGKKYGKLTVIGFIGVHKSDTGNTMAIVRAKCDCGSLHNYQSRHLREGRSISCGCFQAAFSSVKHTKHGQTATMYGNRGTVLYSRWRSMFGRVKSNPSYSHVIIAERWCGNRGFENFVKDMGPMPTPKHTLDRYPISNGNYVPENTRWATSKVS